MAFLYLLREQGALGRVVEDVGFLDPRLLDLVRSARVRHPVRRRVGVQPARERGRPWSKAIKTNTDSGTKQTRTARNKPVNNYPARKLQHKLKKKECAQQ